MLCLTASIKKTLYKQLDRLMKGLPLPSISLFTTEHYTYYAVRHRNWKKYSGSTEPKWPGSRGANPPSRKRIWVFRRPVCCLSVHRNCEKLFCCFVFCLQASEPTFHYFLHHINQFLKLPTYNQAAKVTNFSNFLWNSLRSTCAWAMIYQTIRAEMTVIPVFHQKLIFYEKTSWKCCAC